MKEETLTIEDTDKTGVLTVTETGEFIAHLGSQGQRIFQHQLKKIYSIYTEYILFLNTSKMAPQLRPLEIFLEPTRFQFKGLNMKT